MKSRIHSFAAICILQLVLCLSVFAQPAPMVTYQGTLSEEGAPANGLYDFTFTLYDSDFGAFVVAGPLTNAATPVVNGLFTVTLDFGIGFDGASYWLEVGAVTNGGGTFVTLSPRQLITPAPMAFHAGSASTVDMGTLTDPYFFGTTTTSPLVLSVNNDPALRLEYVTTGPNPTVNILGGHSLNRVGMDSPGSVIAGGGFAPYPNTIGTNSEFSVISGGVGNTINDKSPYSTVSGGAGNVIEELNYGNVVGGGLDNRIHAESDSAAILSGEGNEIFEAGWRSLISGGQSNSIAAFSEASVISGGEFNQIGTQSWVTVIGGGSSNRIENSPFSVIAGGEENTILNDSDWSVIGGGLSNGIQVFSVSTVIGGGENNMIGPNASHTTIGGGLENSLGTAAAYSVIGGGWSNSVDDSAQSVLIAGGWVNSIGFDSDYSVIGGGNSNRITSDSLGATIAGGAHNEIGGNSHSSAIGGGYSNSIASGSLRATIAGGYSNEIDGNSIASTVVGGYDNSISSNSFSATIAGGEHNGIGTNADYAFAAGRRAKANHAGSFVWSDSQNADFESTTTNQFAVRAENGVMVQSTNTAVDIRGGGRIRVQGAGLGTGTAAFIHRATAANISGNYTIIDHPHSNGDPNAVLIVTPNWNPGGVTPNTYNNHSIGVYYSSGKWRIFNQDQLAMPENAAFNVLIIKP